jgi:hypothetical protein
MNNESNNNNTEPQTEEKSVSRLIDDFRTEDNLEKIYELYDTILKEANIDRDSGINIYRELFEKHARSHWCKDFRDRIDAKLKPYEDIQEEARKQSVVVVGAGPGGLVAAMESALQGATVTVIEKRNYLSRNNILHLWPYTMNYLTLSAAKIFYPKFGAGGLDHIGTQQLQRLLIKINLILGVKFYCGYSFEELYTNDDQTILTRCTPEISNLKCTYLIGADGTSSTVVQKYDFPRRSFVGSLCIGITFNFKNCHTSDEVAITEFAKASLYHQAYFQELQDKYNICLENLVYYRGETHYFVMTIKKNSLFDRGVFKEEKSNYEELIDPSNLIEEKLIAVARDTATFVGIPETCEIETNHLGKADVQLFDFSQRVQAEECVKYIEISKEPKVSENQSKVEVQNHSTTSEHTEAGNKSNHDVQEAPQEHIEASNKTDQEKSDEKPTEPEIIPTPNSLIITIIGDALLEPFWPLGTGCNHAVLSALDAAWITNQLSTNKPISEILNIRKRAYIRMKSSLDTNFKEPFKTDLNPTIRYSNQSSIY